MSTFVHVCLRVRINAALFQGAPIINSSGSHFSHWLDTTELCSADEHGCEKWLTEPLEVKYAQKQDKMGFGANMTTVLPPSGGVGLQTQTFSGSAKVSRHPSRVPKRPKWQDRRIIPG